MTRALIINYDRNKFEKVYYDIFENMNSSNYCNYGGTNRKRIKRKITEGY